MKPADLARYYLKFYSTATGSPADNAPVTLLRMHNRSPYFGLLHACLRSISDGTVLPDPSFLDALLWLAANPDQHTTCDEYLRSKKGKKSESQFKESVIAAYAAEQLAYYDKVLKTLQAELKDN